MGRTINHKVHLRQSSKTKITGGNENKRIKASTQSSEIKVKVEAGSFKKHISNDQARKDKYETLPPVVETERLVWIMAQEFRKGRGVEGGLTATEVQLDQGE